MSKLTIISSKDMAKILESLGFKGIRRKEVIRVISTPMEELQSFHFTEKIWEGVLLEKY